MLKALEDEVLIPTLISERSNIKTNHIISKILGELKDNELIEIINPEVRKGDCFIIFIVNFIEKYFFFKIFSSIII